MLLGAPTREIVLRTLGGQVGHTTQLVPSEADLWIGRRGVIFCSGRGVRFRVTAASQGYYPLARDRWGVLHLEPSRGLTLAAAGGARQRLAGRTLSEAEDLVRSGW